jgi:4-hydroxyphenylacetate 3-hydroxylase N terminal
VQDKRYACVFMVPMHAPGVKLISRASYENTAAVMGTPFDYPLSSRLDENDAIFVLENTFIPGKMSLSMATSTLPTSSSHRPGSSPVRCCMAARASLSSLSSSLYPALLGLPEIISKLSITTRQMYMPRLTVL